LIVRLVPLSAEVTVGFEDTILILYPVPVAVPAGIVPLIVPFPVELSVPMLTGLAKLPLASES
jgi:hypothetical protein